MSFIFYFLGMASSQQQKQNEGVRIGIPYSVLCRGYIEYTPPKTSISPENHWLEDDSFPFKKWSLFLGTCVYFREGISLYFG